MLGWRSGLGIGIAIEIRHLRSEVRVGMTCLPVDQRILEMEFREIRF